MFKKTILSVVAIAMLSTTAFGVSNESNLKGSFETETLSKEDKAAVMAFSIASKGHERTLYSEYSEKQVKSELVLTWMKSCIEKDKETFENTQKLILKKIS